MARPFSTDLRQRIVDAVEAGASRNSTAERFDVSVSAVIKLMQRFEATGSVEPGQMGGWRDYALSPHEEKVRSLIAERPDMTLEELREALAQEGVQVGRSSIDRFLKARKLTLKKSPSTLPNRLVRT
jgi:transposase